MIALLSKLFFKDSPHRSAIGSLCALTGLVLNLLLSVLKLLLGHFTLSLAITADGLNNLSDTLSSVVSMAGFRLSAKKADKDHPFGHGRAEYVSALIVSFFILLMGFELGKSALESLLSGDIAPAFTPISFVLLLISIAVKLYMGLYNRHYGKQLDSPSLLAAAKDSFMDCIASSGVLLSMAANSLFHWNIDPWAGLSVALFILYGGGKSLWETVSLLLGKPFDRELRDSIEQEVLSFPGITGVHDITLHDYGPDTLLLTLHAEMDGKSTLEEAHESIDKLEHRLNARFHCVSTIHLDPAAEDNPLTREVFRQVEALLLCMDRGCSLHDLHVKQEEDRLLLYFDAVLPYSLPLSDAQAKERLCAALVALNPRYLPHIHIDREEGR